MKYLKASIIVFVISTFSLLQAQVNHPTISNMIMGFKSVASGTVTINNSREIKIVPEAILQVKPGDIKKIHFTVKKENTTVSAITCRIDSLPELIDKGVKIFYQDNSGYHITSLDTLLLDKYTFNVQTEDSNGNLSPVYSKSK